MDRLKMDNIYFRKAQEKDIQRIKDIYNQAIMKGGITADCDCVSYELRKEWFDSHSDERYPIFVCLKDEEVIGYAYLSAYRGGRKAVAHVAEISYYFDFSYLNTGLGSRMMEFMISEALKRNISVLIAIVISGNEKSEGLLNKFGFSLWGRFPEIVHTKEGKKDHFIYGKNIF